jgi:hypothetical protein
VPAYGPLLPYLPPSGGGFVGGQNPYFNQFSAYGSPYGTPGGFLSTPLGSIGANLQPDVYYQRLTAPYGGGLDDFSRFVQSQQGRALAGLDQARLTHPNLSVEEYLPGVANYQSFLRQWKGLAPAARGEAWNRYPRVRSLGF